jgi:hypothetical protein
MLHSLAMIVVPPQRALTDGMLERPQTSVSLEQERQLALAEFHDWQEQEFHALVLERYELRLQSAT